ncbi:hypothetical protein GCM10028807_00510 [Spirosoma daeguense]
MPPTNPRTTLVNPDAAELKWDALSEITRFDIQWRPAGTSAWNLVENIASAEHILDGLTNSTKYEWQVRSACSATDKSAWSDMQLFQTGCPLPTDMSILSVNSNSAIIQWKTFAADLQWRVAGASAWNSVSKASSPYSLTGLTNNTVYEWRVRTSCSPTSSSEFTPPQLLTTRCNSLAFVNTYQQSSSSLQLSWNYSEEGIFEVQWRAAGTTNWLSVTGISASSYSLNGLQTGASYEWRVRKLCSAIDASDFSAIQLVTVVCRGPVNLSTGNPTTSSIDLKWNSNGEAGVYELQWRAVNSSLWTTVPNVTTNQYTLTNLQLTVNYEWRVRTICSGTSASEYTYPNTFTLQCQNPWFLNVYNISPSSVTLQWAGSSYNGSPTYELQYRRIGPGDWTTITGITSTAYSLTGLTNNMLYDWRVRASCSDFSSGQRFYTRCEAPIDARVIKLNVNSVELVWRNSSSDQVEIQYRETGASNWTTVQADNGETSWSLYNLNPNKAYDWQLRSVCSAGVYSSFGYGPTFITDCYIPVLYTEQLSSSSLRIVWYSYLPLLLPTEYELQWRKVGNTDWNTVSGLTDAAYVLTDLVAGESYEYRVRQVCSTNAMSDYSSVYTNLIECRNVSQIAADKLPAETVRLRWSYAIDDVLRQVQIQYRTIGASNWTTVSSLTGTSYTLTNLTPNTTYEWRIRKQCSPTVFSDFSIESAFVWSCPMPSPLNFSTKARANSASLSWQTDYSSEQTYEGYTLQWRIAGAVSWSSVAVPFTGNPIVYSLTGLHTNTAYEWRVSTNCGGNHQSDYSSVQLFRTSCAAVEYVSITNVAYSRVDLSWPGISLASGESYTVQYRIRSQVAWSEVTGITTTSLQLTGLTGNMTYECRIKNQCEAGGSSMYSPSYLFSTQCPNPTLVNVTGITTQSALLSWVNHPDNTSVKLELMTGSSSSDWSTTIISGVSSPPYKFTGLTAGTLYQYRLQGVCGVTILSSTPTYTESFSTIPLAATSNVSVHAENISAQSAHVYWTGEEGRTNYVLQWRPIAGNWKTTSSLSSTRYILTGLQPNTTYEARVSFVGDDGLTREASTSFVTTCYQPYNLMTVSVTSNSASIRWSDNGLPASVQWRVGGTTNWQSVTGISSDTYSLTGLTDRTLYEWRVLAQCSSSVLNASAIGVFRTICKMPSYPDTRNVTTNSAQLVWNGSGSGFSVRYRLVGTPNWTTITGLASTTYALSGLENNTSYEWAVATVCEPTIATPYTSPLRFQTQCQVPNNLRVGLGSETKATLSWNGIESSYQIEWRALSSTFWNSIANITSPYTLTGLTAGVTYEWRVRSSCGILSEERPTFSPFCNLGGYDQKSVENITSTSAQLIWTSTSLPPYSLRWRRMGDVNWTNLTGNVTSPYTLTGLMNNTRYEWQIANECRPSYGPSDIFQTHCNSPTQLWTEDITTTSVRFRWDASVDGLGYKLRWREVGTSDWNVVTGITDTSFVLACLTNNTVYEWQVRSQCGTDDYLITASFRTVNDCLSGIYSVRDGSWNDPAVWSCNRVPVAEDVVTVNHVISVPANYTAKGLSIQYGAQSKLIFGLGAILKIGL